MKNLAWITCPTDIISVIIVLMKLRQLEREKPDENNMVIKFNIM